VEEYSGLILITNLSNLISRTDFNPPYFAYIGRDRSIVYLDPPPPPGRSEKVNIGDLEKTLDVLIAYYIL
jgi:hypothetical protein